MHRFLLTVLLAACVGSVQNRIQAAETPVTKIAIDAKKTSEPISKYIYGQFIEHLGRCIYGGIWAEMLEDRKFFDPVASEHSPWKNIGPADAATMDRVRPFVGAHTPKISLAKESNPAGISQGGLALRKGRSYVGRIWLCGDVRAVTVSLIWGPNPGDRQTVTIDSLSADYAKTPLQFTAGADSDDGRLEIVANAPGSFHVGTVSLMPADNVHGLRADTLEMLKQLDAPVYRWPGGNFVSGYNWRDGIGDPDRRPPRKNPAWQGIEHNDFGLDEFMLFCQTLKTDPYIAVNAGQGDSRSAVEELEYANAPADRGAGQLRAKNGHPEPYRVRFWGIGNEMYGDWQLGHVPLDQYVKRHRQFADAMRAADPSIKLVAVGAVGPWSETMLRDCADRMDLVSEHFYCNEIPYDLNAHVRQIPDNIRRIAAAHRDYRKRIDSLKNRDIRIALDEWNYWTPLYIYGELGAPYYLRDALGIAAGLHEYARQSDVIFMANYAQTVNVIGCIKTSKTAACLDTTGLVLKLYRRHFGTIPVAVEAPAPLDVAAAWTADRKSLTIGIVNPTFKAADLSLQIAGVRLKGPGDRWQITGPDSMLHNAPGREALVTIQPSRAPSPEETPNENGSQIRLTVEPRSITLVSYPAE